VYYFHNEAGEVIYVGKSINIYKRIQQHFAVDVKQRKEPGIQKFIRRHHLGADRLRAGGTAL
jgi:excinuclease UvrABC nuclease subunit